MVFGTAEEGFAEQLQVCLLMGLETDWQGNVEG